MNILFFKFRMSALVAVLLSGFVAAPLWADHSEEEVIKKTQSADYNLFTGNWDVRLGMPMEDIAKAFKKFVPELDFHLVEEETDNQNTILTFRGKGDEKLVIKLKPFGDEINVRLRTGLFGSESKSSQLFAYVYKRM